MNLRKAEKIMEKPERVGTSDRIWLNNPVIMQGMGLAVLVVMATCGKNALMLAVAVALMLTPGRVLCSLLLKNVNGVLCRAMAYCAVNAGLYIIVYQCMTALFGADVLNLGIYLPILVVDPLMIYRYGRVNETVSHAVSKGLGVTGGYCVVLLLVGCLREILAQGTLFGMSVCKAGILPLATAPAGGFLLVGVLCAIWRSVVKKTRKQMISEARALVEASRKEGEKKR